MKGREDELLNKLIFRKFKIKKLQKKGNFSNVFLGKDIKNNKLVVLKIQEKTQLLGNLEKEVYYLYQLKGIGIPKIISFGHYNKYNVLVEELLGKSLEQLFKENDDKPKIQRLKDVLMVGIQIIDRLKYIHSKYILHLDIKPSNFLVGNSDTSIIYIIDFGFAKKYRSSRTGKHINFSKNRYFSGNLKYSSVNTMRGIEPSRRDDLESLGYMLIDLYKRELPWDMVITKNKLGLITKLFEIKRNASTETICKDLPIEMKIYIEYVKALKFEEQPNYDYLTKLLEYMLYKINKVNDLNFSWISKSLRNNISRFNSNFMRKKKVSPFSKIINEFKAKSAYEKNIGEKSAKNNLNTYSLFKDRKSLNNVIVEKNTFPNIKKVSYTSKCSPEKQINISLGKINDALKIKMKKKYKYIINHNLNRVNQNTISSSVNNSKNDLKKNLVNKVKTRNKLPKYKLIITPILTNETLNIYSNKSSQVKVNLNQTNYKQKEKLETKINSMNNIRKNIRYYSTTGLLSLNKNFIRKKTNIKLDNLLCSDIVYRKKFKYY